MANLYDLAYNVEKEIRKHPDYVTLSTLYAELQANPEAKKLFNDFRSIQMKLQTMQMMGQEIPPEEMEAAQATLLAAQQNEKIQKLMEAEQRFSIILNDLTRIIVKPLEDVYGMPEDNPQH